MNSFPIQCRSHPSLKLQCLAMKYFLHPQKCPREPQRQQLREAHHEFHLLHLELKDYPFVPAQRSYQVFQNHLFHEQLLRHRQKIDFELPIVNL